MINLITTDYTIALTDTRSISYTQLYRSEADTEVVAVVADGLGFNYGWRMVSNGSRFMECDNSARHSGNGRVVG